MGETKKLEREAKDKNKALHQIEVSKEDIEEQIKTMQLNASASKANSTKQPSSKSMKSTSVETMEPAVDSMKEKQVEKMMDMIKSKIE